MGRSPIVPGQLLRSIVSGWTIRLFRAAAWHRLCRNIGIGQHVISRRFNRYYALLGDIAPVP